MRPKGLWRWGISKCRCIAGRDWGVMMMQYVPDDDDGFEVTK